MSDKQFSERQLRGMAIFAAVMIVVTLALLIIGICL